MWQGRAFAFAPILFFFICLFTYVKLVGPIPFSVNSVNTNKTDTFQVSGEGTSVAKPDEAILIVGVSASGLNVKSAQDQINSAINKVSDATKKLGVEAKDIQTTNYNINPVKADFGAGSDKITGFAANTNLQIKVRKIDNVNSVIDAATASGANQVGGITFDVSDKSKAENEARDMAVKEAKKKAEDAARIAGFKLGRIINYSENQPFGMPVPMMARAVAEDAQAKSTQVEPGSSEIKVTVTLSYEIL